MAKDTIYVAKESGSAEIDGEPYFFTKDKTRVRQGHALTKLKGFENLFDPVSDHVDFDIEAATAAPGEKRGDDYDERTVEELKTEVSNREIEGRSELTTKADLIKALRKDDK